jgi:hypothetical protein
MHINEIIIEAKFRPPILMYHGTTTTFLPSILKSGMIANAKKRVWQDDPDTNIHTPSRASLSGSYWTSNFPLANSSAQNAIRKFSGDTLIILAKIQPQQAKADEDRIDPTHAIVKTIREVIGMNPTAIYNMLEVYFNYLNPDQMQLLINTLAHNIHKQLSQNPQKPINTQLAYTIIHNYMKRLLAYTIGQDPYKREEFLKNSEKYNRINQNNWPTITQAEQDYLKAREKITLYYRESTLKQNAPVHTLRITEPVRYHGASKIINIISIPRNENKIIIHWGPQNLPNKFLDDYSQIYNNYPDIIKQ